MMTAKDDEEFSKKYNLLMFAFPGGTVDPGYPECDNRILCMGSNVCIGHEPYSCERMFRDYGCPLKKEKKK